MHFNLLTHCPINLTITEKRLDLKRKINLQMSFNDNE